MRSDLWSLERLRDGKAAFVDEEEVFLAVEQRFDMEENRKDGGHY